MCALPQPSVARSGSDRRCGRDSPVTHPPVRAYLASLNPQLPRPVQILQLGGLFNALGNGIVLPFLLIYLHNVHGFGLGVSGLVLATNGAVSLVAGPLSGTAIDRIGGRWTLIASLVF